MKKNEKDNGVKKIINLKKELIKITPDKFFYLNDGRILKSLKELTVALENMRQETFDHHVRKDKNDFTAWANGVFKEVSLANDLKEAKTAKVAQKILKNHGF